VLDLLRNKKNPDLGYKRRAEVEFFLLSYFALGFLSLKFY